MAVEPDVVRPVPDADVSTSVTEYTEGIRAGLFGAATVALWFFILDVIQEHPLYTPTVLGTALFRGRGALAGPGVPLTSFELILTFTWVHCLVFVLIGIAASKLLGVVERHPNFGFGVVLLFVLFEYAFVLAWMVLAEPVLHLLAWPAVLVGNILAAAAMALSLWRYHPRLTIQP